MTSELIGDKLQFHCTPRNNGLEYISSPEEIDPMFYGVELEFYWSPSAKLYRLYLETLGTTTPDKIMIANLITEYTKTSRFLYKPIHLDYGLVEWAFLPMSMGVWKSDQIANLTNTLFSLGFIADKQGFKHTGLHVTVDLVYSGEFVKNLFTLMYGLDITFITLSGRGGATQSLADIRMMLHQEDLSFKALLQNIEFYFKTQTNFHSFGIRADFFAKTLQFTHLASSLNNEENIEKLELIDSLLLFTHKVTEEKEHPLPENYLSWLTESSLLYPYLSERIGNIAVSVKSEKRLLSLLLS